MSLPRRRPFLSVLATAAILVASGTAGPARAAGQGGVTDDLRRSAVVRTIEKVAPAVVGVYTEKTVAGPSPFQSPFGGDPFFDPFLSPFFSDPRPRGQSAPRRERNSLGSGVIVEASGVVLTNQHVIVGGDTIRVQLSDGREYEAKLVGGDSDFDLAVLRLVGGKESFPYVPIGSDDSILIGETVIAIGNPYGLDHSVTTGVVSAVGRSLQTGGATYQDIVQTDASINPGNSGGPLLDIHGRLIGINTAIHKEAQGIGFAIPIWRVRNVVDQILAHGAVLPTWVGVQVQDLTSELAAHFRVRTGSGVLVRGIDEGSPAAVASIRTGDIITRVQGEKIGNTADYDRNLRGLAAGETLRLAVRGEDGGERTVEIVIASLPTAVVDEFAWEAIGVEVVEARGGLAVRGVRRGSPADKIGFEPGDLIAALGGREVEGLDGWRKGVGAARSAGSVLVSVVRGRRLYRVVVPLGGTSR